MSSDVQAPLAAKPGWSPSNIVDWRDCAMPARSRVLGRLAPFFGRGGKCKPRFQSARILGEADVDMGKS